MRGKNTRQTHVTLSFSGRVTNPKRLAVNILNALRRECENGPGLSADAVKGETREITVRVTRKAIATCHLKPPAAAPE
jgi:hypothetical protein